MLLYHGTSKSFLSSIMSDGVQSPSYWGTLEQAEDYSRSYSDGIIISADIDESSLCASLLMAEQMYENGDIDEIPESDNLEYSLEFLGGITCEQDISDFEVID